MTGDFRRGQSAVLGAAPDGRVDRLFYSLSLSRNIAANGLLACACRAVRSLVLKVFCAAAVVVVVVCEWTKRLELFT